jgi:hypothetical protein
VDLVTIGAVLAAIAGGAGGALGGQLWRGISALVRRPFRSAHSAGDPPVALSSGVAELAALEQAPTDERRAAALAEVLVARAAADGEFRDALQAWWAQANQIQVSGDTANTISGGAFYGPVLQGRDFSGLTFSSPSPAPPSSRPSQEPGP